MISQIWIIFRKELLIMIRDKRTRFMVLMVPLILVPLLAVAVLQSPSLQVRALSERESMVAVEDFSRISSALLATAEQAKIKFYQSTDPEQDLRTGRADLAVSVSRDGNSPDNVSLSALMHSSRQESVAAMEKLKSVVDHLRTAIIAERVQQAGLSPSLVRPIEIVTTDLSGGAMVPAAIVSSILIMIVVTWPGIGSMQTAADIGAGEKERGTLEPLLTTPVDVMALVLGKLLAVFLNALTVGTVAAFAGIGAILVAEREIQAQLLPISGAFFLRVILLVTVVSLFVSSLSLCVSLIARTSKEVSVYLAPFNLVLLIPILISGSLSPETVSLAWYTVPVVNYILLVKGLFLGHFEPVFFAVTVLSIGAAAIVMTTVAYRVLGRESTLRGF